MTSTEAAEYSDRLRRLAWLTLHDEDAAEDVSQEALRRSLAAMQEGRVRGSAVLPYMMETARHVCYQWIRDKRRSRAAMTRVRPPAAEHLEIAPRFTRERTAVRRALSTLSSTERELLRLRYVLELTPCEIASRFRVPAVAIRVKQHRLLRRLRRAVLRELGGER